MLRPLIVSQAVSISRFVRFGRASNGLLPNFNKLVQFCIRHLVFRVVTFNEAPLPKRKMGKLAVSATRVEDMSMCDY
jgi:hypothetical protein